MIQIKTYKPQDHKLKLLVYGVSGSGKTTFACSSPRTIVASAEDGLLSTINNNMQVDFVTIRTIGDLRELYRYLQANPTAYETLVIDSITEINDIIKEGIEFKNKRQMQLQDWGTLANEIKAILRMFKGLDMNVIFIAQEKVEMDDQKIDKRVPSLNGKSANEICYFMDIVAYAYIDKDGSNKITTLPDPRLVTKDRSGLIGGDASTDLTDWLLAIKSLETGTQTVVDEYNSPAPTKEEEKVEAKQHPKNATFEPTVPVKTTMASSETIDLIIAKIQEIAKKSNTTDIDGMTAKALASCKVKSFDDMNEATATALISKLDAKIEGLEALAVEPAPEAPIESPVPTQDQKETVEPEQKDQKPTSYTEKVMKDKEKLKQKGSFNGGQQSIDVSSGQGLPD